MLGNCRQDKTRQSHESCRLWGAAFLCAAQSVSAAKHASANPRVANLAINHILKAQSGPSRMLPLQSTLQSTRDGIKFRRSPTNKIESRSKGGVGGMAGLQRELRMCRVDFITWPLAVPPCLRTEI